MRVARYIRHGHGMSYRARVAKSNNEHPVTYWSRKLGIDTGTLRKLLVDAGDHKTGLYGRRTKFYRLPNLKNEKEAKQFFSVLNSADPAEKKFFEYLSNYRLRQTQSPDFGRLTSTG